MRKRDDAAPEAAEGYSRLQIVLHWTIAALVVAQIAVNEGIRIAFRERVAGAGADPGPGAWFHIISGLVILAMVALRLAIRLRRGAPTPVPGVPPLFHHMAWVAHVALYAALFLMPLTGAIAWFGGAEWAATVHETGRLLFVVLILGHVVGALLEHFVLGNDTLRRMLRATED